MAGISGKPKIVCSSQEKQTLLLECLDFTEICFTIWHNNDLEGIHLFGAPFKIIKNVSQRPAFTGNRLRRAFLKFCIKFSVRHHVQCLRPRRDRQRERNPMAIDDLAVQGVNNNRNGNAKSLQYVLCFDFDIIFNTSAHSGILHRDTPPFWLYCK